MKWVKSDRDLPLQHLIDETGNVLVTVDVIETDTSTLYSIQDWSAMGFLFKERTSFSDITTCEAEIMTAINDWMGREREAGDRRGERVVGVREAA